MHITLLGKTTTHRALKLLLLVMVGALGTPALAQQPTDASQSAVAPVSLKQAKARAEKMLTELARHEDPFIRSNAMEASENAGQVAVPLLQIALEDDHPAVRFAALTAIGKRQDRSMEAAIRRRLSDSNPSVRGAALFALNRIGIKTDLSPLARMLGSQSTTQRSNAALLVGLLNDPSATPMLKEMARVPLVRTSEVNESIVNIQIAEAMGRLGDRDAMHVLRAGLFSQFDEVRILSAQILGRLKDHSMNAPLRTMLVQEPIELRQPIELQLAASEALGRLGETAPIPIVLSGSRSELPTVRSQAALGLSVFRTPEAHARLIEMLDDPEPRVRVAAAAGVLRARE